MASPARRVGADQAVKARLLHRYTGMTRLDGTSLVALGIFTAVWACQGRDETTTDPSAPDSVGAAGTPATTDVNNQAGASNANAGSGGQGGAGAVGSVLDDPLGVGPLHCDLESGEGGDACINFSESAGFYTEPEHLATNVAPDVRVRIYVASEFTPSTALKQALDNDVHLRALGSDTDIVLTRSWVTEGVRDTEVGRRAYALAALDLVPAHPLVEGWYSVLVPVSAREALSAKYDRGYGYVLLKGGSFVELESHGLRADFQVGSSQVDGGVEPDAAVQ
jgi:hypothetical protein